MAIKKTGFNDVMDTIQKESSRGAASIIKKCKDSAKRSTGRPKVDRETKKPTNLTLFPSIVENIRRIAVTKDRSTSDLIGVILKEYIINNRDALDEYETQHPWGAAGAPEIDKLKNTLDKA